MESLESAEAGSNEISGKKKFTASPMFLLIVVITLGSLAAVFFGFSRYKDSILEVLALKVLPTTIWEGSQVRHRNDGLLVIIPCATNRHSVVYNTRNSWRKGLKAYILSNGTQADAVLIHGVGVLNHTDLFEALCQVFTPTTNHSADREFLQEFFAKRTPDTEVWGTFPDESPSRGYTPGDLRMLAAVRLANESFAGKFKWMMYGDDDVVWFMDDPNHNSSFERASHKRELRQKQKHHPPHLQDEHRKRRRHSKPQQQPQEAHHHRRQHTPTPPTDVRARAAADPHEIVPASAAVPAAADPHEMVPPPAAAASSRVIPGRNGREDMLVVVPCSTHRHSVAYAARKAWHAGMLTFVASNGSQTDAVLMHGVQILNGTDLFEPLLELFRASPAASPDAAVLDAFFANHTPPNEVWGIFPDESPSRGYTPGDLRMLAAVRLANESFAGQFKWMMYGDDDVVWFMDNVFSLLSKFNSGLPYLISDDIGGCCHGGIVRCKWGYSNGCLPEDEESVTSTDGKCLLQPAARTCTRARLEKDDVCKDRSPEMWFNGGRGALISAAMLTQVSSSAWKECELHQEGGGDARVSNCLWKNGFGPTNPTRDLSRNTCRFGRIKPEDLFRMWKHATKTGVCDTKCQDSLDVVTTALSIHHGPAQAAQLQDMHNLVELSYRVRKPVSRQGGAE